MPPVGFEPTISAGERPQTHALDRVATGTGYITKLLATYRNFENAPETFHEVGVNIEYNQ